MRKKFILQSMGVAAVAIFAGCGGGISDSIKKVTIPDYSFVYDKNMTGVTGYFIVSLNDVSVQNRIYKRDIKFSNFVVKMDKCNILNQKFDPSQFSIGDNGEISKKVNVNFTFNNECNETNFTIKGEKLITITYNDKDREPEKYKEEFLRTFNANIYKSNNNDSNYTHSGKINNISLVYKETKSYDDTTPYFTDVFAIHAIDEKGKPADAGEKVHVGTIIGIAKSAYGSELFSENGGKIVDDNNSVLFKADKNISNISTTGSDKDSLIILPNNNRFSSSYLGGWDIDEKIDDYNLSLNSEGYNIDFDSVDGLEYVIGNQNREPICGNSPVANINSNDGLYPIDNNGTANVELTYDPSLLGKTVYLYANSSAGKTSNKKRVGTAISTILIGKGIKLSPNTVNNDDNTSKTLSRTITFKEVASGDPFQNTRFSLEAYTPEGKECSITSSVITDCDGEADINITVPSESSCDINARVVKEH